jgi:hypothetical protein
MGFEDLPRDWPRRPVTDPDITADLLDLVIGDRDRSVGALGVLLCGRDDRLVQPIVVGMPDLAATAAERRHGMDTLCAACGALGEPDDEAPPLGMLVGLARPGSPLMTAHDRRWRDTVVDSCHDHGVVLLGVWLVTPGLIRPLPPHAQQRRSA